MKKLSHIINAVILSALCLSATCGCNKKASEPAEPAGPKYLSSFKATIGDAEVKTTTSMSTLKSAWEADDAVLVSNGTITAKFVYNAAQGTFVVDGEPLEVTSNVTAVYPFESASFDGSAFAMTIPDRQIYYEDMVKKSPLAATMNAQNQFVFKNICSILKINCTGEHQVDSITFTAAQKGVAGAGTIADNTFVLNNDDAKTLTMEIPAAKQLASQATSFCIIIPSQTYTGGFTVTTYFTDGTKFVKSTTSDNTLERGCVYYTQDFSASFFSGGNGTAENPYKISSAEDFAQMAALCNANVTEKDKAPFRSACYKLMNDIDFGGATVNTICNSNGTSPYNFFCGVFDGNNHTLSNLKIANTLSNKAHGLFGYLDLNAAVRNINFSNVSLDATTWNVATVVGCIQNTGTGVVVENITVTGASIKSSDTNVAGIVGKAMAGIIRNCNFSGNVSTTYSAKNDTCVGGITGTATSGTTVTSCTVTGTSDNKNTISAPKDLIGGIAGFLGTNSTISDCSVAYTSLSGRLGIGGIVGRIKSDSGTANVLSCSVSNVAVSSSYKQAGCVVGNITSCQETVLVQNCTVAASSVKTTDSGDLGGVCGRIDDNCPGAISFNLCSVNCDITCTGTAKVGNLGGIVGNNGASSGTVLIANSIYYGGSIINNGTGGGLAGIIGNAGWGETSTTQGTMIANCASFPTLVHNTANAGNIAGIVGYTTHNHIDNCYCPAASECFKVNNATTNSSRGSIFGWMKFKGYDINCYYRSDFKEGNKSSSYTYDLKLQGLTDEQMKNSGSVTVPSSGVAYDNFILALNAGAAIYNAASPKNGINAVDWKMGTNGYPVPAGTALDSTL